MAKDPRVNFYPDNWSGGTKRMSFEQKGAYMELLVLNHSCLTDGVIGFTEEEAINAVASATAYPGGPAALWNFLMPKFKEVGGLYYSERWVKEFKKSQEKSDSQTEKANKRWRKENNIDMPRHIPRDMPINRIGNGDNIITVEEGVQGEKVGSKLYVGTELYDMTPMGYLKKFLPLQYPQLRINYPEIPEVEFEKAFNKEYQAKGFNNQNHSINAAMKLLKQMEKDGQSQNTQRPGDQRGHNTGDRTHSGGRKQHI